MQPDHINEITEQAEEAKELLKKLSQIPAPTYHEKKRAAFCRKWLTEAGAKGVYVDDAGNVVYPYGFSVKRERGKGAHDKVHTTIIPDSACHTDPDDFPIIVFAAHLDTVFPDTEPMPYKEYRERIYCPGIYDDTVNLVNLLLTARFVTSHHILPKDCGILFVGDTGEEGMGNLRGVRQLFSDYSGHIKEFYTFDLVYNEIVDRAVGSCRFNVTSRTHGGHSYLNFGNENAIQKLAALVQDIYAIDLPKGGKSTVNVGTISGGTSVNTIAQRATMLCEYRSDSAAAMEKLDTEFRRLLAKHKMKYDIIGVRPGENLSEKAEARRSEMLDKVSAIVRETTDITPKRISSSTDCNIPLSLGVPAICIGTCLGRGAHTREEYLVKSSLVPGRVIATEIVLSYCQ